MPFIVGMDEAGYGPNLGPLVVTATVWEVPGKPGDVDFWGAFRDVISQTVDASRLHLSDSKDVYSPSRGLGPLERTVRSAFGLLDRVPESFTDLLHALCDEDGGDSLLRSRWCRDEDLPLPFCGETDAREMTAKWAECCEKTGIRLRRIQSDVVSARRFNRLIEQHGNKAMALSRTSLRLLRSVWDPASDEPTLVIADKHGGRNRYDELLDEITDGRMIFRQQESRPLSCYRVGNTELRFQMKAESHLPVALASMVCKYVRELSMELFNRFWQSHVPSLKPTKGYPVDAKRFKTDIAEAQERLGVTDEELWRCR